MDPAGSNEHDPLFSKDQSCMRVIMSSKGGSRKGKGKMLLILTSIFDPFLPFSQYWIPSLHIF